MIPSTTPILWAHKMSGENRGQTTRNKGKQSTSPLRNAFRSGKNRWKPSIGGEQAFQSTQFLDTFSRQLQGAKSALEQSPRFRAFIPFIFRWEGGYEKRPPRPRRGDKLWDRCPIHPGLGIRHLTKDAAEHIYWNDWGASRAEALRYPLGEAHFNAYVNVGPGQAATLLGRSRGDPLSYVNAQETFYQISLGISQGLIDLCKVG